MSITKYLSDLSSAEFDLTESLQEAVKHLLKNKKGKTMSDIAKKSSISNSLLSQYLSGNKPITENFITKFNTVFDLDLYNPASFVDDEWIENYDSKGYPPIPAEIYIQSYSLMRTKIKTQYGIIKSLEETLKHMKRDNLIMIDMLSKIEKTMLKQNISGDLSKKATPL